MAPKRKNHKHYLLNETIQDAIGKYRDDEHDIRRSMISDCICDSEDGWSVIHRK